MENNPGACPEARLARLVAATPSPPYSRDGRPWRLDLIYLCEPDQQRLEACLR